MSGTPEFYDTKATVKAAADIVDLIERFIPLRRKGAAFVGHCPWHDDKSPSFQVDQRRQSWVCWVCNIRGDVFDFIMRREGIEFYDALKMLADIYNIPIQISNQPKAAKGSPRDKQTLYEACQWAEQQFQNTLLNSDTAEMARKYLADRGIDQDIIKEFQLGFAPPTYNWMTDLARKSEFSNEVLEACDLLIKNNNSNSYYERFRGRLIFPIRDTLNRPIAFGGRLVPGVFEPDKEPPGKYVNSRETRLFSKSDTLYGLNLCKNELNRIKELTVVEGYTDVIAAWQAGLRNVVACLGTALTSRHIKLIKRYADRINLVLDGDTAGLKRANEILDLFVAENVDLRILSLPENADPFDYLREHGKAKFETEVARAPDALQHKVQNETAGIDLFRDTHAANVALENILSTLAKTPNSLTSTPAAVKLKRDQLLSRIAKMFGLEISEIRERLREVRRRQRPQSRYNEPEVVPQSAPINLGKMENREVELLQLLLIDNSILDEVIENISPDQFVKGPLQNLYQEITECFHNGEDIAFESLMLRFESMELKNLVAMLSDLAAEKQTQTGFEHRDQLECLLKAFESVRIKDGSRSAISELQQKQLDEQEESLRLEQLLELARQRKGLMR